MLNKFHLVVPKLVDFLSFRDLNPTLPLTNSDTENHELKMAVTPLTYWIPKAYQLVLCYCVLVPPLIVICQFSSVVLVSGILSAETSNFSAIIAFSLSGYHCILRFLLLHGVPWRYRSILTIYLLRFFL